MSPQGDHKRLAILRFIADHVGRHGFAPSIREICAGAGGVAHGSIARHLQILQQQGRIVRAPNSPRALQLVLTPGLRVVQVRRCNACGVDHPDDLNCGAP